jgi:hypothetical protein
MAVRFDATGEYYSSTSGLPSGTTYTACCWVYLAADMNRYSDFVSFEGSASSCVLETGTDGTTFTIGTWAGDFPVAAMSLNTWYHVACSVNAGSMSAYISAAGTSAYTTISNSITGPNPTTSLTIGSEQDTNTNYLNGRLAAVKTWNAALTENELLLERQQYLPVRTANLQHFHPFRIAEAVDYSGNGYTLTGGTGASTEDGPPVRWGSRLRTLVTSTPIQPTVDVGKDMFGTAGFEISIQAVESGGGITDRSWTVVSGPAEVATEIGTTSLLSWFPATAGAYELEYRVWNSAGQAYDTVFVTVNATGTVVASASISGTSNTITCSKPTGTAEGDVMLAVQSGDFNDHDLMTSPLAWQPLFEYDVGFDSLHVKGWTLTAGASEPASYDFTQGTGSAGVVTIVAMRGVVEAGVRFEIALDTGTTASRPAPSVEGAVDGSILLCGATTDPGAARSWTPPTGMTEQADMQSSTATTHSVASLLDPGDPTGTKSFTLSGTTAAPGGIQWSAVFPMPPDPQRRGAVKSMFTVIRTN